MQRISKVSGVTILGDGEIVVILHVPDLIYSARILSEAVPSHLRKMKRKVEKQRILVVDDSLNTREVEKNILEALLIVWVKLCYGKRRFHLKIGSENGKEKR